MIRHSTAGKLVNLFIVELERLFRRQRLTGRPYILIADTASVCNLRCPLCPTGRGQVTRKPSRMKLAEFRTIIDRLGRYLYEVNLHNWGEPFLNEDIFGMIEYASLKNIGTNLSSNLNFLSDLQLEHIFTSKLEYLVVSLDGITQKNYSKYRIKGDLASVMKNLRAIVDRKKKLGSHLPVIEWQFIVMKHNMHEVEDAVKIADDIGVDMIRFIPPGIPFGTPDRDRLTQEWFPDHDGKGQAISSRSYKHKRKKLSCFYLYRSVTINSDGGIAPCCVVYKKSHDFASFFENDFDAIWNGEKYRNARSLFCKTQTVKDKKMPCIECDIFRF